MQQCIAFLLPDEAGKPYMAIPYAYLHDDLRLMDLTKAKTGIAVPEFGVN